MADPWIQELQRAGFQGDALRTAWAVSQAEGGSDRAHNYNPATGDDSYGRFQINMLGDLGPDRRKRYGLASNEALYDPKTNAAVAFRMSGGGRNWQAWSAYKNGSYEKYLNQFPGAKGNPPPATKAGQAAGQAFASGPAGIAAGPSPQQFAAQAAGIFMQQAQAAAAGQPIDFSGLHMLAQAKRQMAQASSGAAAYGGSINSQGLEIPSDAPGVVKNILSIAHQQVGKPYVWGAESPAEGGFDCSGLIDYAYKKAGVKLPGRLTTQSALKMGSSVMGGQYRAGDMVITNGGQHMVMYVGNGQVIAAPHRGETVQYQPLSRFKGDIVDVRRVL